MSAPVPAEFDEVLARYGLKVVGDAAPCRVGIGFSGADVWRVETTVGPICVRRWPLEHPTPAGLRRIHEVLRVAFAAGCNFIPCPFAAVEGSTVVEQDGRLWEVTPWMPGRPDDTPQLSDARRAATWQALARFHRSQCQGRSDLPRGRSPGLVDRLQKLDRLPDELVRLRRAPVPAAWQEFVSRREAYLQLASRAVPIVRPQLVVAAAEDVLLIPCIRDIRREHVLFSGDELTGWVDFGALADENPAADAARVLSEFCDEDRTAWASHLAEYDEACRGTPLAPCSPTRVDAFDRGTALLAPGNWLRWILLEGRDFADRAAVYARFDHLLWRLRRLVETA